MSHPSTLALVKEALRHISETLPRMARKPPEEAESHIAAGASTRGTSQGEELETSLLGSQSPEHSVQDKESVAGKWAPLARTENHKQCEAGSIGPQGCDSPQQGHRPARNECGGAHHAEFHH